MSQENQAQSGDGVFKLLLPYLVGTAFVAAALVLAVLKFSGGMGGPRGPVNAVVFDVVKLANAQRAVASSFIKSDGEKSADSAALLMDVSKRTRESILKVAGASTLVLVKQGVVSPELPDITDDVLKDLGLPTQVPTQDTMGYLTEVAPTYLSMFKQPQARPSTPAPAASGSILP